MPLQEDDWNNLLFTDPAGAVNRIKRETLAEARAQAHRDYFQVTNRAKWEKMFYGAWPHLASHKELVEEVMGQVGSSMPQNTPIQQANVVIGERVEAILKHRKRFGAIDDERAMWSGSPEGDGPPEPTPMNQGRTLSDTITARRERRRERSLGRTMSGEKV
jgi:hypothetical protein